MPFTLHPAGMGMIDKDLLNSNLTAINIAGMTTAQRTAALAASAEGTMVYDTTLHKMFVKTAAAWEQITSA